MGPGRKMKKNKAGQLTPLELRLMQILWEKKNANAAEIQEILKDNRPLASTTIHTVLANLRKKGYIQPIPTVERALRFAPRISRNKIAGRSLTKLIAEFFNGSPGRLMAHLLKEENLDEDELKEIRSLISNARKKGGKSK